MSELEELVKGRRLQIPTEQAELIFLGKIQWIQDVGNHDLADKEVWTLAVLAVRELEDLRKKK
jgi:hypothetical protein